MIDLRAARNDPDGFRSALARKGAEEIFDALLEADAAWRKINTSRDAVRARQKAIGKPSTPEEIAEAKSLPYFLEFAAPNVTKAAGLEFVAERLGFERAKTVSFGDGENDVELVDWAGFGIAVANAHDRVLAAADFVCPDVREEGVAQVIGAYLDSRQ